jgi:hypothetical protein
MTMTPLVKSIWVPDGAAKKSKSSLTVSTLSCCQSNIKNYSLKIQKCLNIYNLFDLVFKQNGVEWDIIMDELHDQGFTHRTIEHIKSLYYKVSSFNRSNNRKSFLKLLCLY